MTTIAGDPPTETPFSAVVRASTTDDHSRAEGDGFFRALTAGELPRSAYIALTAQQWLVYRVLEEASEHMRKDPVAGAFVFDELTRTPALEADLRVLLGDGWAEEVDPTPATAAYCDRLRQVAFDWPAGFVAHHYTRYLGDLSGGQFIRRAVERVYDVSATAGAAFYDFGEIDDLGAFKDGYRRLLDEAPWPADERTRFVDEVRTAYGLNTALVDDLAGGSRVPSD